MTFWAQIRARWASRDDRLAKRELRREVAGADAPRPPHTGGALFDEPLHPQGTEDVPGDDRPTAPPD